MRPSGRSEHGASLVVWCKYVLEDFLKGIAFPHAAELRLPVLYRCINEEADGRVQRTNPCHPFVFLFYSSNFSFRILILGSHRLIPALTLPVVVF